MVQLEALLAETEQREKEVLLKRKALGLLPSARDNIGIGVIPSPVLPSARSDPFLSPVPPTPR